jgi:hypothetical protein
VVAPYMLAFQEGFEVDNLFILDSVLNILFFIDIIVNFNTAVLMDDLDIVDDRRVILLLKKYLGNCQNVP